MTKRFLLIFLILATFALTLPAQADNLFSVSIDSTCTEATITSSQAVWGEGMWYEIATPPSSYYPDAFYIPVYTPPRPAWQPMPLFLLPGAQPPYTLQIVVVHAAPVGQIGSDWTISTTCTPTRLVPKGNKSQTP